MNAELNQSHLKLHAFNRILSVVIQTGIIISLAMVMTGLAIYTVRGDTAAGQLTPFLSLPARFIALDPAAFITLGLITLLLMPPVVLIASSVHFIAMRQTRPVIVCVALIILLAVSITVIMVAR